MNSADRKYFDDNHADLVAVLERIALALEVRNSYEEFKAHPQRWIVTDVKPFEYSDVPNQAKLRVLSSDYRDDEAFE